MTKIKELLQTISKSRALAKPEETTPDQCPSCETDIENDVTLDDHGVCFDCHHEILNGERCRICFVTDHGWEDCPEIEGIQL